MTMWDFADKHPEIMFWIVVAILIFVFNLCKLFTGRGQED